MGEFGVERMVMVASYAVLAGLPVLLHHGVFLALGVAVVVGGLTGLWLARFPPRTRLLWFGLALPVLAALDHLFGTPALVRVIWHQVWTLVAVAGVTLVDRWEPACKEGTCSRLFLAKLVLTAVVAFAAVNYKLWIFSDGMLSQDTAYFEQGIWGFVTGRNFFQGSSQGWWRYSPPLESHFAMHFSPALFPLAGLYGLWPGARLLHLVQVLAVVSSAIPLFLWVRRIDPVAALLFSVAYLVSPAVIYQTQLSFHVLSLAAPALAWAAYFFVKERLAPYVGCLALACCVREDLALATAVAGLPAWLVRPRRRPLAAWVGLPLLLGLAAGAVALTVTRSYCPGGNEVIQGLFSHAGASLGDMVGNAVHHPIRFLGFFVEPDDLRYLVGIFRPGLFAALLHPLTLVVAPALAINLLARGAGTASLDMYYSVYIPPVTMIAAVAVWLRLETPVAVWAGVPVARARRGIAVVMVLASILGLPSVFGPRQLAGYVPAADLDDIRTILDSIPADASVAAPRYIVHALAQREELYLVNRFAQYARYDPDYVVVETDFSNTTLNDGTLEAYRAYARTLAEDPRFEVVVKGRHLVLYRKRALRRGSGARGADRYPGKAGEARSVRPTED